MSSKLPLAEFTAEDDTVNATVVVEGQENSAPAPLKTINLSAGHSVRLGNVIIREYERTLGDNLCSSGPPIGIGWNYRTFGTNKTTNSTTSSRATRTAETEFVLPVEKYEQLRGPPAHRDQLLLSRSTRESILIENGFAREQIAEAVRQNIRVKNQRRQTLTNLKMEPYEELLERWAKRVKKILILDRKSREKAATRQIYGLYQDWINNNYVPQGNHPKGILIKGQETL
jgi:hypothetical protein